MLQQLRHIKPEILEKARMAALNRPTEATYVIHDKVTVETSGECVVKVECNLLLRNARIVSSRFVFQRGFGYLKHEL